MLVAPLALEVVEVDLAHHVGGAAQRHHARTGSGEQRAEQQSGEREVAEMIGPQLRFEAVGCCTARRRHHAGIVDQQIDAVPLTGDPRREGADRREVRQVELLDIYARARHRGPDRVRGLLALADVSARDHDRRAGARELTCGDETETAVGAGDDRETAALIGDVLHGPLDLHLRRSSQAVTATNQPPS